MNKTTVFLLSILSSFFNLHAQAQCHKDDWDALKAFYESTNGDNWTNRTGWDMYIANQLVPPNNCDLNTLYGVTTTNGRVTCIDMDGKEDCVYSYNDGNNLDGILPSELGKLSHLTYLNLKDNQLSGSLPVQLGNLTNLRELFLNNNRLSGSLPAELGNLTNLVSLFLSYNQFNSSLIAELGDLTNLEILVLDNNQLSGNLPVELSNLTNLRELFLYNNQLNGSLPIELGNLTNLEILRLENNQLSGSLPAELGNLTNLRELFLNNNQLSGSLPAELGTLTNLVWLFLSYNQFNSSVIAELGNLTNLEILVLDNNQLSGNLPVELGTLTNLRELFLYNNQLTGNLPAELCNLNNLKILRLDNNRLNGNLLAELGNLINLEWLFLNNNQLDGSLPVELGNLTNLEVLRLENNQLSGDLPTQLGNLTNLRELFLNNNKLKGNLPAELGDLTNLVWLFLSYNQFDGSLPAELCHLTNLTILSIRENNLQGCYPVCMNTFCVQLNDPYFYGSYDVSDGNNFDANWEDFCAIEEGACPPYEHAPTNYSGYVSLTLDNDQNILKNKFAIVYDYRECHSDLENCAPVNGYENKSANEALWAVTKAAEYFSTYFNIELPVVNIEVNNTNDPNRAYFRDVNNVIELGAGDGVERNSMAAPDLTAHEYLHFLQYNLDFFSPLNNVGEPGALRESMADIFGEIIEHYCYGENDWVLASQVMSPVSSQKGIRNFSYPKDSTMSDICPDTYLEEPWIPIGVGCTGQNDWCGIHTNCGVHNHWFYILTNNIGMEAATNIIFKNFTENSDSILSYYNAATRSIKTVEELYGNFSTQQNEVINAWYEVGIDLDELDLDLNFIQWRIEVDTIISNDEMEEVRFDLVIDSLGQDISADSLELTLHLDLSHHIISEDSIRIYKPLDANEVEIEMSSFEINIKINRQPTGNVQSTQNSIKKIKSNQSILGFSVCIDAADGGEKYCYQPIQISGHTTIDSNKNIDFRPDELSLGSCIDNADGSEGFNLIYTALDITQKNCYTLGTAKIEAIKDTVNNSKSYTYKLFSDGMLIEHIKSSDSSYLFDNLDEGYYTLELEDNNNGRAFIEFEIKFVAETEEVNCCPENLIIPPGNIKGSFNADTISFENGSILIEGEFNMCD